jgi:SulP family sulfate permease
MLLVVSRLKLATVIQFLPMPVIGGYLAFIGFYCGQAGLALMSNVQLSDITEWYKLLAPRPLTLITPGTYSLTISQSIIN